MIFVDTRDVDLGSYVNIAREHVANTVELPSGYSLTWSGQYEYMVRAMDRLLIVVPVTLIIIFILLYLNFRKIRGCLVNNGVPPFCIRWRCMALIFIGL